jgi:hypothetical protein
MPAETLTTVAFAQLLKYNAATGELEGVIASERTDKSKEALNYTASKDHFKKWSQAASKRSGGKSLGNVREMHELKAVGKLTALTFDDTNKRILVRAKIVDPVAKTKCEEAVYTGFSIGGSYVGDPVPDSVDPTVLRYIANPSEVSLVDDPCNPDATFQLLGADGATKVVKFAPRLETIAADDDDVPPVRPNKTKQEPSVTDQERADVKAQKKVIKKVAKKVVAKALKALFEDKESPLVKLATAVADRPTKKELVEAQESLANGLIDAIRKGPLDEKDVKKTTSDAIRLVPDDESKTGEPQDDESKALRKVISDATEKLQKRAKGADGAEQSQRRVANEL